MALFASEMLDSGELQTVKDIADAYQTDPNLILAIGWHETQWGKLGDGRLGMYTGYGSYDDGSDYGYSGLTKQVEGTAYKMMNWGIEPGNVQLAQLQLGQEGSLPTGIYATGQEWAGNVYNYYKELMETGGIDAALGGYQETTSSGTGSGEKTVLDAVTGKDIDPRLATAASSSWLDYLKAVNYNPVDLTIDQLKSAYRKVKTNTTTGMNQAADRVSGAASKVLSVDTYKWTRYGLILLVVIVAIIALFMGLKPTQKLEIVKGGEIVE